MTEQTWFPFFENITGKTFLVVGGGAVAHRKVKQLLQFSAQILVIAPETDIDEVQVIGRSFAQEDLALGDYVIAATGDHELNRRIALLCREKKIPVNVADDPSLCSWQFPAIVHRGNLTVGISTGGTSPAYAALLRAQLEKEVPDNIEDILECMQRIRCILPDYIQEQRKRRKLLHELLDQMLAGKADPAEDAAKIVKRFLEQEL